MKSYIGTGVRRVEGADKVQGKAKYAADYYMDEMLHIALVRSQRPHAIIKRIDTSAVEKGVFVYTAADFENNILPWVINDQPALACDKVRFLGEPIAVVAAPTLRQARENADRVVLEYESLACIGSPAEALADGAVKIHEGGNLLEQFHNCKGNPQQAFSSCDLVLEQEFDLPTQDHACLEPEASFSFLDEQGRLHLIASTQNAFADREMLCHCLGLEQDRVVVKAATVGGGFGGKDGNTAQIFSALVSHKTGRPSKLVFTREESILTTFKRHAANIKVKMGFASDGSILAYDGALYLDTGAYAALGPAVLSHSSEHLAGPYNIPNVEINSYLCYTNKTPASAMRGFGAPQGAFATETLLNRAATLLGIDPIEIRLKNALEEGMLGVIGQPMDHTVGLKEALRHLQGSEFWQNSLKNDDPYVGYGMAAAHMSCGMGKGIPDTATVEVEKSLDGGFIVRVGMVDMGQGSQTAFAMMAAEQLSTDIQNITVLMADTENTQDCGSTAASRSCFVGGNALTQAVADLRQNLAQGTSAKGTGSAAFPENRLQLSRSGLPHAVYGFMAQAVRVRVNPISGRVSVTDAFTVTEAGKIINPLSMAGQMHGGVAMSTGYTLSEVCSYKDGRQLQKDFATYLLPTALDVPRVVSENVETYEKSGPYGLKGAAEAATVPLAPAITAAIGRVAGIEINRLPVSPEAVLKALKK